MPEQFDSVYRIVGFGDQARRMALYDIPRDDSVWVNTIGYEDEIRSVLEEVQSGNVVEATVTDEGDENEYWNLLDFEIVHDSVLYYIPTDGYAPGPVDDFWAEKDPDSTVITAGRRNDDTGEIMYEIQLQSKEVETEDGETLEVYPNLQRGELLTEPLFEGNGCDYLEDGAQAVLVVNPEGKEYLVFYLFPEQDEKFEDVWGTLYEYVEG